MQLREHQIEAVSKGTAILKEYGLLFLVAQMRTGKSIMSMAIAKELSPKKVLFVSPLKAHSSINKDYQQYKPGFDMFLINYESLHKVETGVWDVIIFDESHKLGAFPVPAKCAQEAKRIANNVPIIYCSGTVSAESYCQLFHQMWVSSSSPFAIYPNFYKWANDGFVNKKKKYIYNREMIDWSFGNREMIDNHTKHLFVTCTQEEANFSCPVIDQVVKIKMLPQTYYLAKKLIQDRVYTGKSGETVLADTAVKLQIKLQQIYTGTVLCESGDSICFDHSKAKWIKENMVGKKIAIYYLFKEELAMLQYNFGYERLTEDPEEFRDISNKIFVSQVQSGSQGVNLATADYLIMMNIPFSNLLYHQVRARIQDQKREKDAVVIWLFAEGGIEEKVWSAVQNKQSYILSYFKRDYGIRSSIKAESNESS